jgi:hypothetical protein
MGDHVHERGESMVSYRVMAMDMEGSRDGTDRADTETILSPTGFDFRITPLRMPMTMHMVGVMYAPSDRVTLMLTAPFTRMSMDHQTRAGGTFTTRSSGVGDVSATALVSLFRAGRPRLHLNAGLQFPSG